MMRLPGPVGLDEPTSAPPVPGAEAVEARVARFGGRLPMFRAALAAGLAAGGGTRDAATIAAWRSGVVGLREDALERAASSPVRVAAAALAMPTEDVPAFLVAQRTDPFARPGIATGALLHRAGGFTGLGGRWQHPPVEVAAAPGGFAVSCADRSGWLIVADAFGAILDVGGDPPDCAASESRPTTATATIPSPSYVVEVAWAA